MEALGAGSSPPGARFVGGCVRDSLLDRHIADVDVATVHKPRDAGRLLERAGVKIIPTGIAHGTVTAMPKGRGRGIEVTTLRHDIDTYGRRAKVEFSDDWMGDASRRDFTFNALYADPDGTVYDPFDGRADLAARRVRFIGQASSRIHEDYLRVLRYFRFLAWHGKRPDRGTLNAASKALHGLENLSGFRVRAEMLKLLAAPNFVPAIRAMAATGVLGTVLGGRGDPSSRSAVRAFTGLARLARIEAALDLEDPLRRLALLVPKPWGDVRWAARLRLARPEQARLRAAMRPGPPPRNECEARLAVWERGREAALDRILIGAAMSGRPNLTSTTLLVEIIRKWRMPRFPLRGGDVSSLGISPGPQTGELLRTVETWWADGGFVAPRDACLRRLRQAERDRLSAVPTAPTAPRAKRRAGAVT